MNGEAKMSDDPSDSQIALLCDIGQSSRYVPPDERRPDIEHLKQMGYVEIVQDEQQAATLQLTKKATTLLSARGATLNES